MKKLLSIMLLILLSGCSFQMQRVTPDISKTLPPVSEQPDVPTFPATETPPAMLDINATDDFVATKSAAGTVPTETPQNVGAYSIQFAPNGTYLDLVDSISVGTSKTYTVSASKSQVMSVSMNVGLDQDWTVIPLQITGADGTILCDPIVFNIECYFWRGVLPASQDYFITLKPETNVSNFILRVAIAPPGTQTQTFSYTSQNGRASLMYTDEFAPVHFPEMHLYKFAPELALQFIDTNSLMGTNLVEAYYFFGASNDPVYVNGCLQPPANVENEIDKGSVTINGVTFVESQRGGAAAGNLYEQTYFRTVNQWTCYDITFFIHYADMGVYAPNLIVKEFDREALMQKLRAILATVVIK